MLLFASRTDITRCKRRMDKQIVWLTRLCLLQVVLLNPSDAYRSNSGLPAVFTWALSFEWQQRLLFLHFAACRHAASVVAFWTAKPIYSITLAFMRRARLWFFGQEAGLFFCCSDCGLLHGAAVRFTHLCSWRWQ